MELAPNRVVLSQSIYQAWNFPIHNMWLFEQEIRFLLDNCEDLPTAVKSSVAILLASQSIWGNLDVGSVNKSVEENAIPPENAGEQVLCALKERGFKIDILFSTVLEKFVAMGRVSPIFVFKNGKLLHSKSWSWLHQLMKDVELGVSTMSGGYHEVISILEKYSKKRKDSVGENLEVQLVFGSHIQDESIKFAVVLVGKNVGSSSQQKNIIKDWKVSKVRNWGRAASDQLVRMGMRAGSLTMANQITEELKSRTPRIDVVQSSLVSGTPDLAELNRRLIELPLTDPRRAPIQEQILHRTEQYQSILMQQLWLLSLSDQERTFGVGRPHRSGS